MPPLFGKTRLLLLACVLGVLLLARTQVAFAHAILMHSSPEAHATVSGDAVDFNLRFNSRIDAPRSLLILVLPDGKTAPVTILKTDSTDTLAAHAGHLQPGTYTLRWQVLANDGHISRGEIPFTVRK